MNTPSEEILENASQRRKSLGSGGASNFSSGKTRRYSVGVTSSRKSNGEEGHTVPNYLRASTGSCHDFCKFGKKHDSIKSAVPVKFKRTTIFNKDKVPKTVVLLEKKNITIKNSTKPEIRTPAEPVKVTRKDVLLTSKKPQSSSINRKTTKNEGNMFHHSTSLVKSSPVVANREGSNGGIKNRDVKTVKTTGAPKTGTVKKVDAKVIPNESQSPKASFGRAAGLKAIKSRGVKQVTPLKDKNRMQKPEPKETIADEGESKVKPETMEIDFMQSSMELVNPLVCNSSDSFSDKNVVEQESPSIHPVYESSELFSDKEVLEEILDKEVLEEASIAPPVSESSESLYDDEVLENKSDYTDDEEAEVSEEDSETANVNEMETSVGNRKIPRKGKMVISEDNTDEAVKLRFRRGKIIDLQSENNSPRRLKFRRRIIEGNEDVSKYFKKSL